MKQKILFNFFKILQKEFLDLLKELFVALGFLFLVVLVMSFMFLCICLLGFFSSFVFFMPFDGQQGSFLHYFYNGICWLIFYLIIWTISYILVRLLTIIKKIPFKIKEYWRQAKEQ